MSSLSITTATTPRTPTSLGESSPQDSFDEKTSQLGKEIINTPVTPVTSVPNTSVTSVPNTPEDKTIFGITKKHKIEQLDKKSNTDPKITKLIIIALVVGFLAGVIGLGAFLPQVGLISAHLGITGISMTASIPMMALGAVAIASYIGLRIKARISSGKAKAYLEDIHLKKSQWFLEGNLNSVAVGLLFILMAMTFIHAPWLGTLKGCLSYSAGILLFGSGVYQLLESLKGLSNAKQIGDKKEAIKQTLNLLAGIALAAAGFFMIIGMVNSPISIILNLIVGGLTLSVAGFGVQSSYKLLKEVNKVNENDPQAIVKFFKESLNITEDEKKAIQTSTELMKKDDILKWIDNNSKNWEEKQKDFWNNIKAGLENAQELEIKEDEIKEIQKLIINEEIKNAIERKIESFKAVVNEDTFNQVLEVIDKSSTDNEEKIKSLFKKVKSEIKCKAIAEIFKIFLVFIPLTAVPLLHMSNQIGTKFYDYAMALLYFFSLGVNITPRFRNVSPKNPEEAWDINKKLEAYELLSPELKTKAGTIDQVATEILLPKVA